MCKQHPSIVRLLWPACIVVLFGASSLALQQPPTFDTTMRRMSAYVASFVKEVTAVVAEEVYEQHVTRVSTWRVATSRDRAERTDMATSTDTRRLVSDFLMVKVPGGPWLPFRDVFEVDGRRVRDREDRLRKLFVDGPSATAIEKARQVREESARYNLGGLRRDVNVPTLALTFGGPDMIARFKFSKKREETFNGIRVWVLEYHEKVRPTVVRTPKGEDVPAAGELWVDPENGTVVRTTIDIAHSIITVTYSPRPETPGLWMPLEMKESYQLTAASNSNGAIVCTATYSNFRRFQVTTQEKITIPK